MQKVINVLNVEDVIALASTCTSLRLVALSAVRTVGSAIRLTADILLPTLVPPVSRLQRAFPAATHLLVFCNAVEAQHSCSYVIHELEACEELTSVTFAHAPCSLPYYALLRAAARLPGKIIHLVGLDVHHQWTLGKLASTLTIAQPSQQLAHVQTLELWLAFDAAHDFTALTCLPALRSLQLRYTGGSAAPSCCHTLMALLQLTSLELTASSQHTCSPLGPTCLIPYTYIFSLQALPALACLTAHIEFEMAPIDTHPSHPPDNPPQGSAATSAPFFPKLQTLHLLSFTTPLPTHLTPLTCISTLKSFSLECVLTPSSNHPFPSPHCIAPPVPLPYPLQSPPITNAHPMMPHMVEQAWQQLPRSSPILRLPFTHLAHLLPFTAPTLPPITSSLLRTTRPFMPPPSSTLPAHRLASSGGNHLIYRPPPTRPLCPTLTTLNLYLPTALPRHLDTISTATQLRSLTLRILHLSYPSTTPHHPHPTPHAPFPNRVPPQPHSPLQQLLPLQQLTSLCFTTAQAINLLSLPSFPDSHPSLHPTAPAPPTSVLQHTTTTTTTTTTITTSTAIQPWTSSTIPHSSSHARTLDSTQAQPPPMSVMWTVDPITLASIAGKAQFPALEYLLLSYHPVSYSPGDDLPCPSGFSSPLPTAHAAPGPAQTKSPRIGSHPEPERPKQSQATQVAGCSPIQMQRGWELLGAGQRGCVVNGVVLRGEYSCIMCAMGFYQRHSHLPMA